MQCILLLLLLLISIIHGLPIKNKAIHLPLITNQYSKRSELYNQHNIEYLTKIQVGTPPQEFLVSIDTGSSDLWIPSMKCKDCPYKKFNNTTSSTFKDIKIRYDIQYGAGSVKGEYVQDDIFIDDVTVKQIFGLTTSTKDNILSTNTKSNGILGLGFPALTATSDTDQPYLPFVFNLYHQNLIKKPVFSISLANKEFMIGDQPTEKIDYLNVLKSINSKTAQEDYTFWTVPLKQITLNGTNVLKDQHSVILDTGTTLSYVRQDMVEQMLNKSGIDYELRQQVYHVDCKFRQHTSRMQLMFDDAIHIDVALGQLVFSLNNDNNCVFGFSFGYDQEESFIFGDSILKAIDWLVFDFEEKKVGFVKEKILIG